VRALVADALPVIYTAQEPRSDLDRTQLVNFGRRRQLCRLTLTTCAYQFLPYTHVSEAELLLHGSLFDLFVVVVFVFFFLL
jgi:hypothetical protein